MTDLVLVRHGETVWHAENRYAGVTDVDLTDRGREQALRLAGWAKTARPAAVWSSPLTRARQTAQSCADVVGVPLGVDARLRELDFGAGEGLTSAEMGARFPAALESFRADPAEHHLPGGENPFLAAERFVSALDALAGRHPDGRVLVVAHTTVIRLALCRLLGIPLGEYRRVFPFVRNCGITEIRLTGGQVALLEFNTPVDDPDAP